jgi:diaminohydroxyphosphoribosylaminopyrimidine deaminase/5-amino-6-(5-phosphoribosylamino)uracil reductase
MSRALTLAGRGQGEVSPNPLVGAVVVKQNRIIGEGWHRQYGGAHAEAEALEAVRVAGETPEGADLYCTLEPCCFTAPDKHQPPCTNRIIESGIRQVYIANLDPNPKVHGGGVRALRDAGITVRSGLLSAKGACLNRGFFTFQRLGRPFVRLKIAQSLDGRIACANGDSRWITDEAARRTAHRLRSAHDAVLIGRGTALKDDPELTTRLVRGPNPLRVLLDSKLSLPLKARLLHLPDSEKTLVLCAADHDAEKAARMREYGAQVVPLEDLSPAAALGALGDRGIRSVLVEGGGAVVAAFLKAGLWDSLTVFTAPILLGRGIDWTGDLGIDAVRDAVRFAEVSLKHIGKQVLFEGLRESPAC